jgi:DNA-binding MarR family transcriptional regulator
MKLEDEIKQKSFKNEYHKLVVNLFFTGSWMTLRSCEMLKPFKLTTQQYNILRILKGQYPNPATVNLLIERMLDKMSNASRIVDRLVAKKLVERKASANDRRCVDVVITDKGLKLLDKIALREVEFESKLNNLTNKEAKEVNRLLDKLRGK